MIRHEDDPFIAQLVPEGLLTNVHQVHQLQGSVEISVSTWEMCGVVSQSKDTMSRERLAYTTVFEEDIFAKEGWYFFNHSCLDNCKVIVLYGVRHWESCINHLMHTTRVSIVNSHILSQRSYRSLGNGINVWEPPWWWSTIKWCSSWVKIMSNGSVLQFQVATIQLHACSFTLVLSSPK
jgi:hypothetical protein